MSKVGIYSGSFDPIHSGHIAFAEAAIKQCQLDKIFFLVEPRPRRKQGVKAFEHRTAMVRLAIRRRSEFGSILLQQQRFTVQDTLPILQQRFKGAELFMLMGDDFFKHLASWPHIESLISDTQLIIGCRQLTPHDISHRVAAIEQTKDLQFRFTIIQTPQSDVSSSHIRTQLKRGQTPEGLDANVLRYIKREGLYESKLKS